MVVTAGSLVPLAGPAQAYDNGTCDWEFGAGNVTEVDTIRVNTGNAGKVDFGDNLHLGGAPQGNGVACWARNGKVAVVGRVFADADRFSCVHAKITYYSNGVASSYAPTFYACGNWGVSAEIVDDAPVGANYDRVRIRLYTGRRNDNGTLIHTSNRYRG